MRLVLTASKAQQVGHMKDHYVFFFFTCPAHASHYSTRKTVIAPSKREKARHGHYHSPQTSFQVYLTLHMSIHCEAECALNIPLGQNENINRLNCVSKHAISAAR